MKIVSVKHQNMNFMELKITLEIQLNQDISQHVVKINKIINLEFITIRQSVLLIIYLNFKIIMLFPDFKRKYFI